MEIMLKDLVWKYQNKEIALKKLESHIDYLYSIYKRLFCLFCLACQTQPPYSIYGNP